jgi:hypothetical protein
MKYFTHQLLWLLVPLLLLVQHVGCTATCRSRADCLDEYEDCSTETKQCEPDAVSVAARAYGIKPARWVPPPPPGPLPKELIEVLRSHAPEPNPSIGYHQCIDRIQLCRRHTQELDQCVASAPRCVSAEPWRGDPAGPDCCPSKCLLQYFGFRKTRSPGDAMSGLVGLNGRECYPGLQKYLEGLR